MAMGGSYGLMEHATKETGMTTRCMGRECLLGLMAGGMKALMKMIRNMGMGYLPGLMAGGSKACGEGVSKSRVKRQVRMTEQIVCASLAMLLRQVDPSVIDLTLNIIKIIKKLIKDYILNDESLKRALT
jgi:hypothetical protein